MDPYAKDPKELEIYNVMVSLLDAEKSCLEKIRESESEVSTFHFLKISLTSIFD